MRYLFLRRHRRRNVDFLVAVDFPVPVEIHVALTSSSLCDRNLIYRTVAALQCQLQFDTVLWGEMLGPQAIQVLPLVQLDDVLQGLPTGTKYSHGLDRTGYRPIPVNFLL